MWFFGMLLKFKVIKIAVHIEKCDDEFLNIGLGL